MANEPDRSLRDRTAIVGVGYSDYSKNSGVSTLTLALRAITAAVADAGLDLDDLDGVACHRYNDSVSPEIVAQALGLHDVGTILDVMGGGSSSAGTVGMAAQAVASGQCSTIVVWRALNARSGVRMGGTGWIPPGGQILPYLPYWHVSPIQTLGMSVRPFLWDNGLTEEDLGLVAISQRNNAMLSPRAMMKTPFTMEEYLASKWIVEPLRLLDCCLENDAAVAVVITTPDRARDLPHPPVLISAAGFGVGSTLMNNQWGESEVPAARLAPRLFAAAGMAPSEVDIAELYDAYTPLVPMQLDAYGLCPRGESAAFIRSGAIRRDGALPVNTHGGHLSEGYVHGINHIAEAVNQLRGSCGERQVDGAEVALCTGQPGINSGLTSAVVLRRAS